MAAIRLEGAKNNYVFSVLNKQNALPALPGFYILISSRDKYGIKEREVLNIGYTENFEKNKYAITNSVDDYTHIYLMPDFEREPNEVLSDIELSGILASETRKAASHPYKSESLN